MRKFVFEGVNALYITSVLSEKWHITMNPNSFTIYIFRSRPLVVSMTLEEIFEYVLTPP